MYEVYKECQPNLDLSKILNQIHLNIYNSQHYSNDCYFDHLEEEKLKPWEFINEAKIFDTSLDHFC